MKNWGYRDRWEVALVFRESRISRRRVIVTITVIMIKAMVRASTRGYEDSELGSSLSGAGFIVGFPWDVPLTRSELCTNLSRIGRTHWVGKATFAKIKRCERTW